MSSKFYSLLESSNFVFLDGGMGTMLQSHGIKTEHVPELLNLTDPEAIMKIHRLYVESGADIIYANTFGANRFKLAKSGHTVEEVVSAGVKNARTAAAGKALVALDMGPIGQLLEPAGTLKFEEAYEVYKELVLAGKEADVIVIETMTDLYEVKAAVLAAKENSDKPILVTMTFEENMRTFTGVSPECMVAVLEGLGADAIGVNCSLGPDELFPVLDRICALTTLPVIAKPNAGLPDPVTNEYNVDPDDFAASAVKLAEAGVTVFGGCCGTTPQHISAMIEALSGMERHPRKIVRASIACSAVNCVNINQPRVIGERINPTGKKRFKEALLAHDVDYILGQAVEQIHAGAEILDVNVGLPGIDEKEMMVTAVKAIQSICDTPLQLDSTIPEVLEAGLRVYNGKPIVNSVNGEDESLEAILPLVKKYGAAVVGLALDKGGIPKTADGRFAIAEKILRRAMEYGIPKEDVFIDCLTLTASAEQDGVMETLNALHRVKTELGLNTVLGVSNISFGLPNRELITRTFLTMALHSGLTLPIINPNVEGIIGAVRAYRLLAGIDRNSAEFISIYAQDDNAPKAPAPTQDKGAPDIMYAVENGLKNNAVKAAEELMKTVDPMEIINGYLIPALDNAGAKFEKGKIFLPQLILTAEAAQACFEVIKTQLSAANSESVSKGKVVLATVHGDIHDIGKNIVKVLLDSYGFTVIDLGKDVPPETIVNAAIENKVSLVGLSALMTTTLGAMAETIKQLNEKYPECKTVVGGAVLTASYAEQINADYYAKDAKQTVDIASQVYGA
ncbi:homocysteine S-methyltransferase family protein [Ruminococcus flavefaciens]|uniref:homocysteine S-methyltransferase family protein n=1 Tax=Ruminococcus flavefaciens TaxID=1265 RepID=UPI0026EDC027|nr:homocysteine S-methyltransferase family protein [Ruminococcus flavefaciens]MDD7517324.1 homocysteine S-methyltransferase family protein [Ruminococcus flavefaciens]MDY5690855.1 homocysteine S-methyltransferase family protein [Ruminococcus flavefaciens]